MTAWSGDLSFKQIIEYYYMPIRRNVTVFKNYDSDISIKTFLTKRDDYFLEIIKPGSIVIESKYILDIVRKIDSETIEIEVLDGCTTRISGNHSDYKINGMYANEYPMIDFSKCDDEFMMDSAI